MPRYIDADWIYEKVENRYRLSSGIEHRCERDLLDLICDAPTADVVPKSEVDKIFEEIDKLVADLQLDTLQNEALMVSSRTIEALHKDLPNSKRNIRKKEVLNDGFI